MDFRFDDIGNRLKAFRLGSGLGADEIARRLGISRAALYRFEKGELTKIETLQKLSVLLGVSVPTLLGVGVEYIASAVAYFERLRQIEETAERIVVLAGPVSYLLTSDSFDDTLAQTIHTRYRYTLDDIVHNARFTDILSMREDGARIIDFDKFHDIEMLDGGGAR